MALLLQEEIISKTRNWIEQVIIGLNFCPFAAKPYKEDIIDYKVIHSVNLNITLESFIQECYRLEEDTITETSLIIFSDSFTEFKKFLDLIDLAEQLLKKEGFEGIYQIASFHPDYIFEGSNKNDASNYTNRSPYPILQILREDSVEEAIKKHKDIHSIPDTNIAKANQLGLLYFKTLGF